MIDKWLSRKKRSNFLESIAEKYLLGRVKANTITYAGLGLGLSCSFLIFLSGFSNWTMGYIIISTGIMVVSFFMDTLDGALARIEGPTIFGGIIDLFCDRTVEISIILALISTNPGSLLWPGIFSLAAIVLCITIFLSIGAAAKLISMNDDQKLIYYSGGIMERSETFIFLIIMNIFTFLRIYLFWLFALLIFITVLQRIRSAYLLFYDLEKNKSLDHE